MDKDPALDRSLPMRERVAAADPYEQGPLCEGESLLLEDPVGSAILPLVVEEVAPVEPTEAHCGSILVTGSVMFPDGSTAEKVTLDVGVSEHGLPMLEMSAMPSDWTRGPFGPDEMESVDWVEARVLTYGEAKGLGAGYVRAGDVS